MKTLLTFFAIVLFNLSYAQFISSDDALHFGAGAVISSATYSIVYSKTKNKKKAFWFSLATATFVGLSKEIYDGFIIEGRFDTGELVATFSGGLVASYAFNIFTGRKKKKQIASLKSISD